MTVKVGQLVRDRIGERIKKGVKERQNIFLVSYTKISSAKMDDFRKTLNRLGAKVYVSKNSVARRALNDLKFQNLSDQVNGQTAFIWSDVDAVEVSKALIKFAKGCEGLAIKGGLLQGKVLAQGDVNRLSDLPSREALLSMLLQQLQSPLTGLAGVLNAKTRDLVYVLKQLSEKKGGK